MSTVALDRIPLNELLIEHTTAELHEEPVMPFDGWRRESTGEYWPIIVTALMERTAAFHALGDRYDTGVLRLDLVFVEARSLQWKPKVVPRDVNRRWNGVAPDPKGSIAKSDARALADQARKREQSEREESLRRASVGSVPEGKEVPTGIVSAEVLATPKTCRVCRQTKPREEFPKTGRNAGRCYSCAELEAAGLKLLPIKRSVKAKAAQKLKPSKGAAALLKVIPAESKPSVLTLASGSGPSVDDALVNLVKNLIAERNTLRAQLDAIEAALVHA